MHSKNEVIEMSIEKIEDTTMKELFENFSKEKAEHFISSMRVDNIVQYEKKRTTSENEHSIIK